MGRRRRDRGATGLEYGLLVAGVAMAALVGASTVGPLVSDAFACVAETMTDPSSTSSSCRADAAGVPDPPGGGTGGDPAPGPDQPPADPAPTPSPTPTVTPSPTLTPSPTPSTAIATP